MFLSKPPVFRGNSLSDLVGCRESDKVPRWVIIGLSHWLCFHAFSGLIPTLFGNFDLLKVLLSERLWESRGPFQIFSCLLPIRYCFLYSRSR